MVRGKTKTGFEYEINPDKFKDARFLMKYATIKAKGDEVGNLILLEWILGPEAYENLCKHCENKEGIAPIESVTAEIKEILDAVMADSEIKNSFPSP